MKKLKLNYTCTDPDCAQYMAKVTDTRYSYIEYREWFGNYIVCHAVVDLQDYTLDEICTYCSSYYASLEQMVADYGFRGAPSRSLKSPPSCVGRPAVFGAADASERASEMFLRTGAFFSSILSEFLKNLVALQTTWSLMQNKKVKAPQSSSFTNGWRADLIWRYIR